MSPPKEAQRASPTATPSNFATEPPEALIALAATPRQEACAKTIATGIAKASLQNGQAAPSTRAIRLALDRLVDGGLLTAVFGDTLPTQPRIRQRHYVLTRAGHTAFDDLIVK